MQTQTDTLLTNDGLNLHTITWLPDTPPQGAILLVHGIGEHSGRYTHVAQALTDAGYAVYSMDHRGHGKSDGIRTYFEDYKRPVDDLEARFDAMHAAHPALKHFVFGHSLGSLLSLMLVLRRHEDITGWITEGTPLNVDESLPGIVVSIAGLLTSISPKMRIIPLDGNGISRDPEVVAAYEADPLVDHERNRIGMVYRLVQGARTARQQLNKITLPVLILHGSADPICPPSGSDLIYKQVASTDKTLTIFADAYHEVHNEPEQTELLQNMVDWLALH